MGGWTWLKFILYFSSVIRGHVAWSWRRDLHGSQTGKQTDMKYRPCSAYLPTLWVKSLRRHDLHWRFECLECLYVDESALLLVVSLDRHRTRFIAEACTEWRTVQVHKIGIRSS